MLVREGKTENLIRLLLRSILVLFCTVCLGLNGRQPLLEILKCQLFIRVKSGNFIHQVYSDIHLQTVEIQMRGLLMSCLIAVSSGFSLFA